MGVTEESHRIGWGLAALALIFLCAAFVPHQALADGNRSLLSGEVRIHVLPFSYNDAIIIECDGHFGVVDSGEDDDYPDGSDPRYPPRDGTIVGGGHEDEVIAYMRKIGVTQDNLDFYIGTHSHSDHIGSAPDIIEAFHPKAIYLSVYDDSLITDEARLWDNQFVYDKFLDAAKWAQDAYGARFIQHLDSSYAGADDSDKGSPVFMLGDAKIEILNYDETYLHTKVPDANYFSYGVKITAANGRTAFLAGDINNYTDGMATAWAMRIASRTLSVPSICSNWAIMALPDRTLRIICAPSSSRQMVTTGASWSRRGISRLLHGESLTF